MFDWTYPNKQHTSYRDDI